MKALETEESLAGVMAATSGARFVENKMPNGLSTRVISDDYEQSRGKIVTVAGFELIVVIPKVVQKIQNKSSRKNNE